MRGPSGLIAQRERLGVSWAALARLIGRDPSTVYDWGGRTVMPLYSAAYAARAALRDISRHRLRPELVPDGFYARTAPDLAAMLAHARERGWSAREVHRATAMGPHGQARVLLGGEVTLPFGLALATLDGQIRRGTRVPGPRPPRRRFRPGWFVLPGSAPMGYGVGGLGPTEGEGDSV